MSGLPIDPVAHIKLCSLQQIAKNVRKSVVEEAWIILLQPHSEPVTREVIVHSVGYGNIDVQTPSRWDKLVAEFYDIFDPPGMPVERDTVYQIELLTNAEPYYRR